MNAPEPHPTGPPVVAHRLVDPARDGFPLGATLYAREDQRNVTDAVVFNSGGGLACARYRHFLAHLAGAGLPVLAYDYRGVGASRPERLRGFGAGLEDWAEYDQAGAIDALAARFPRARLAGVSHSIGCLVACTAPNASRLHQMVYLAPHTGYWRDYRTPWRWPLAFAWHVAMPMVARLVGYFPGSALKLGDDFPLRFALQWAGRHKPEFHLDAGDAATRGRQEALLAAARALEVRGFALNFSGDAFVGETAVRRFLFAIPNAPVVRTELGRETSQGKPLGHFGFFSRRHADLWGRVTHFLRTT